MTWNTGAGQHFIAVNPSYSSPPYGLSYNLSKYNPDPTGVLSSVAAFTAMKLDLPTTGATFTMQPGTYLLDDVVLFQGYTNLTVMAWGVTIKLNTSTQWGNTGGKRYGLQFNDCPGIKIFGLNGDGNGAALLAAGTTGWFAPLGITSSGTKRDLASTYITIDALLQDVTITNYRALALRFLRVNGLRLKRVKVKQGFQDSGANNAWDAVNCVKVDRIRHDDCDMDGGSNSSSTQGTIGNIFAVSPGTGNDDPVMAINQVDILNYNRLSQFLAPPAASAVSTTQVSYGNITNPAAAPVTTDGGVAGTLTGATYTTAYTLLNAAGETQKSPDSTGLALAAGHQINVAGLSGLPNGVWGVKLYITNATDKGLVTIAGSTIIPVVANATAAVSITAPGDGSNTPGSNTTAATETYGGGDLDYLANSTWYFFCVTPGAGANMGIIPSAQMKVTAVDQTNKLITFERHDTTEAGAVMNWAGQQVYFCNVNLNLFCDDIRIRNSRFFSSGMSGGVYLLGCKDFAVYKSRAGGNADIAIDAEWCIDGEVNGNKVDCTGKNTAFGSLFLARDVSYHHNRVTSNGSNAILQHSGYTIASHLDYSDNACRGAVIQIAPTAGQGWDNIVEDVSVCRNKLRGDSSVLSAPALRSGLLTIGVQDTNVAGRTGGRMRGVQCTDNIFDSTSQRPVVYTGLEGASLMRNHFRNTGYEAIYESNNFVSSLNVSIEDNFLSNIGTRGVAGVYRSAIAHATAAAKPFIGRQFEHSVDPTLDVSVPWYLPVGVPTHPVGGDYLAVGPSWLRHSQAAGGQLQVSVDATRPNNGVWAPIRKGGQQSVNLNGGTVTIDVTAGEAIIAALTASTTIAFSNEAQGQEITVEVNHDATATAFVLTWPANVKFAAGAFGTTKAGTDTANSKDTVTLVRDATNWVEKSRAMALS